MPIDLCGSYKNSESKTKNSGPNKSLENLHNTGNINRRKQTAMRNLTEAGTHRKILTKSTIRWT
jgi:hypothetical protein